MVKVNFDASISACDSTGLCLIARGSNGDVLDTTTSPSLAICLDLVLAEALCFRWALSLASDLSFRLVCFETDCMLLFKIWKIPF